MNRLTNEKTMFTMGYVPQIIIAEPMANLAKYTAIVVFKSAFRFEKNTHINLCIIYISNRFVSNKTTLFNIKLTIAPPF